MDEIKRIEPEAAISDTDGLDAAFDSPTLRRLIEEVRNEDDVGVPRSYNRTFNRHNR